MDRDDIIRMAREAGVFSGANEKVFSESLERFAALVAANEREQSAKVVENYCGAWDDQGYALAAAIRKRGQE